MRLVIDGHAAYVYTGGKPLDPALPGVVFIHGALHDHSAWSQQSRYLAHHGYAVMAVDLPGHGRSDGPALGVEAAGRWVTTVVQACGVKQTAVVGHSMGSLIALEAAALLGERASHLFMVGTTYPMKVSAALLELAQRDPLQAIDQVNTLSIATQSSKPSHPGPGFWIHGGNRALMRRILRGYPQGNLFHHDFAACDAYQGLEATAPGLRCPVTLVLGAQDQMTPPKTATALAEKLAARVVRLPSGHMLMGEVPDALLDTLVAGLRPR